MCLFGDVTTIVFGDVTHPPLLHLCQNFVRILLELCYNYYNIVITLLKLC